MKLRLIAICLVFAGGSLASPASGQSFPVAPGALEFHLGFAGTTLAENETAPWSVQPTVRVGLFLLEGVELAAEGGVRVWPLGSVAPQSFNFGGSLLWYPTLASESRNLYLLGGASLISRDPDGEPALEWDFLVRGGVGVKVPLTGPLEMFHLSMEFRSELLFADDTDIVSGIEAGFSYFL